MVISGAISCGPIERHTKISAAGATRHTRINRSHVITLNTQRQKPLNIKHVAERQMLKWRNYMQYTESLKSGQQ